MYRGIQPLFLYPIYSYSPLQSCRKCAYHEAELLQDHSRTAVLCCHSVFTEGIAVEVWTFGEQLYMYRLRMLFMSLPILSSSHISTWRLHLHPTIPSRICTKYVVAHLPNFAILHLLPVIRHRWAPDSELQVSMHLLILWRSRIVLTQIMRSTTAAWG